MKKRGVQVLWSIASDVECSPELAEKYFGDNLPPENDAGSALSKAVKEFTTELLAEVGLHEMSADEITKALRGRGVKYKDRGTRAFAIVKPFIENDKPVFKIICDVECVKKSGTYLTFNIDKKDPDISDEEFERVSKIIQEKWQHQRGVLDRTQIASMVTKFVRRTGVNTCNGVSLRPRSGGVYFVANRHQDKLESLGQFFDELGFGKADLIQTPIFDEESWNTLIENGAVYDTTVELEKFLKKFQDDMNNGGLTKKAIKAKMDKANDLREQIVLQEDALWRRAAEFKSKSKLIFQALEQQLGAAEDVVTFDLMSEMRKITDRKSGTTIEAVFEPVKVIGNLDAVPMVPTIKEPETERETLAAKDPFDWLDS